MGDRAGADLVVLGGGPAGLGAALAAARHGARTVLLEASGAVGGLCVTRTRDGVRYDLGGHIPFVRDAGREAWLRDLLGDDLVWVPRPVVSVRDGRMRPGRYLDQRPGTVRPEDPPVPEASAADVLGAMFGPGFVDLEMRAYLEKIDGVPLERIPGTRPLRLMHDQAAPDGFWFPAPGIGRLMDAMHDALVEAGGEVRRRTRVRAIGTAHGRVRHVEVDGPDGPDRLAADRLVVAVPAGLAAPLLDTGAGDGDDEPVAMRAVCLVFAAVDGPPLTDQAWVQVDDPAVPFARVMEVGNWSARMAPPGTAVLGMECYCDAAADDPVWSRDDDALVAACARALADPLGWLDDPRRVRALEVVRLPRAYPLPDMAQMPRVARAAEALAEVGGVHVAPGADVIAAIGSGERAAAAALSAAGPPH